MKKITTLLVAVLCCLSAYSQTEIASSADSLRKDALNVFMSASSYLKERITYINYVRDVKVADLVIISTSERNGAGGSEHTMFLEGQRLCKGMSDTLRFSSSPDDTYDQIREKEVKTLKAGLIRYIMKTPLIQYVDIRFTEPISSKVTTDNWNNWVFRTSISAYVNGQSSYKASDLNGSLTISKVTEDWKFNFYSNFSSGKDEFVIGDDTYYSPSKSNNFSAQIVKSINDHWSYGGNASSSSSTFSNYDLKVSVMPGIEYNIFPYAESTRRQFTFMYTAGYMYNNYTDTTIFNVTENSLFSHSLRGSLGIIQKWGSADMSISWSNYLRDFSENSLSFSGSVDWRIAKGLSLNLGGYFSFIHNQISLVKGGLSTEDILLRRKEMATDYTYFVHVGFSYTFGSIYSNVVNPRFGGGGGSRIIMF